MWASLFNLKRAPLAFVSVDDGQRAGTRQLWYTSQGQAVLCRRAAGHVGLWLDFVERGNEIAEH